MIHLVYNTRDTVRVENYWFCEVIIQGEGIMNKQFPRVQNIESLELILELPNNILPESDHETDLKGCLYFEHLRSMK